MTIPRPRVPIRFESVEKMLNGNDLKSLIVPVEEGLRKFDHLHDEMTSSFCGAFLVLRGETGSGKTTLLHTLGLFRKEVQTVSVRRDEPIREGLQALGPGEGALRVVVIESREALGDTSDVEIESAILAINAFVRSTAGERTVVVWPCNSEPIADKLAAAARQIGGEALLGVEEPVFRYTGPARSEYLRIARQTVATFNADFREGVTCLIDPQVARMNACVGTAVCSDAADLDLRASKRVRQAHRSSSHPRHGLRRLGQA